MLPQPSIEFLPDNVHARITHTYTVRAWPVTVTIRPGFVFDGASIPRLAQPFIGGPWDARRLPAATVHDWLYASHALARFLADLIFLRLLLANGHGLSRSLVDWWAVARFGRPAFNSHTRDEQRATRPLGSIRILPLP